MKKDMYIALVFIGCLFLVIGVNGILAENKKSKNRKNNDAVGYTYDRGKGQTNGYSNKKDHNSG